MQSVLAPAPQLDPARRLKKAHTGSKTLTLSSRISIFTSSYRHLFCFTDEYGVNYLQQSL